jgi:hypothetical protein
MKCSTCGEEHELLEPSFHRPEAVVQLASDERAERVKESDDLCVVWARSGAERHRFFVRCVMTVPLLDGDGETGWGLWAEVEAADFRRIVEMWTDAEQAGIPPMRARVANRVPGYPETVGLPVILTLTGPTTRPRLAFDATSDHPLALECQAGVCTHRVMEWLADLR